MHLYVLQGLNFIVPLVSVAYLLRKLGPTTYGLIAFAQALVAYAVVVTDYGFPLTAARAISIVRDNPETLAKIFWTTMLTKVLLLLASVLVLGSVVILVADFRRDWHIFAACSLVLVGNVAFPVWYLQGVERLRQAASMQLISRILLTALAFIFVRSSRDAVIAAGLVSAPLLLSGLSALLLVRAAYPPRLYRPTLSDIKSCLADGWYIFAGSVSTTLYLQTNAFVLGLLADKRSVAFFSVGYSIVLAVQGLSVPATQSVYPRISLLFSESPSRAWQLVRKITILLIPAMAVASVLMAIFAKQIVELVAGSNYVDSVSIIRIMAVLPIMISLAAILGPCVMINVNLSRELMWIYLFVGVLNVLLLPFLVLRLAAAGAAASLVIAETFGPLAMYGTLWINRRRLSGRMAAA